jgi:hypothetical protein
LLNPSYGLNQNEIFGDWNGEGAIDDIAALVDMLQRLRAVDTGLRVFGSGQHRYRLGPVLSEAELAVFERGAG